MIALVRFLYLAAAAGMALYGLLGLVTLWYYWRNRDRTYPCPAVHPDEWPLVTVQLPIYNERYVVAGLIHAAAALRYPADRLEIQVLDDSTDDTTAIAAALVSDYRRKGVNICRQRRPGRGGFKGGALAAALLEARGHFLAVFDADFRPAPDFLLQTMPHFLANPALGLVQARWGHLNAGGSPLTAAQAIALDKHFALEQTVRHRANLFPRFNGSAGVWRRACLEDAGGWQADTVCEDLCLSTRAALRGWQFLFLNDVVAPAELPDTIAAYKSQQARWAKGSLQCLLKYGRPLLGAGDHSWVARLYAILSMSAYLTHPLLLLLLFCQVLLLALDAPGPGRLLLLGLAGVAQPLLFLLGQRLLYPDWRRRLRYLPALLLVAVGIAPSNGRALLQALLSPRHPFVRTPKGGRPDGRYQLPFDPIILVELLLAGLAAVGLLLCLARGDAGPLALLAICCAGFGYVAYLGLTERRQPGRAA